MLLDREGGGFARQIPILTALVVLFAALRAWFMGPMWLDKAFLSFSYSDRIARTGSVLLAGQSEAHEAFSNPLWVALFSLLGRFNVSEVQVQTPLGMLLYSLVAALLFRALVRRFSPSVTLVVMLIFGLAPFVAAARDGSDSMLLALLSLWATLRVSEDQHSHDVSTLVVLVLLTWSGVYGWLVALGLACFGARKQMWTPLRAVALASLVLVALRLWFFDAWLPPLQSFAIAGLEDFRWLIATLLTAGCGAILMCWRHRAPTPEVWVLLVGVVSAGLWVRGLDGFGAAVVPMAGVLLLVCGELLARIPGAVWVLLCGSLLIGIDGVRTEMAVEGVRHERLRDFHQGRGMGRFLLWRFEENDQIVVHRAGVVGYFSRRGMIDLSGVLHGRPVTPEDALLKNPVAVLPHRSIVSHKAQRILMDTEWPRMLEDRYKQYAIQHQKQWQMVDMHPVWFHLYIRKDLPMLRPEIPASNGNIMPKEAPFQRKE